MYSKFSGTYLIKTYFLGGGGGGEGGSSIVEAACIKRSTHLTHSSCHRFVSCLLLVGVFNSVMFFWYYLFLARVAKCTLTIYTCR